LAAALVGAAEVEIDGVFLPVMVEVLAEAVDEEVEVEGV